MPSTAASSNAGASILSKNASTTGNAAGSHAAAAAARTADTSGTNALPTWSFREDDDGQAQVGGLLPHVEKDNGSHPERELFEASRTFPPHAPVLPPPPPSVVPRHAQRHGVRSAPPELFAIGVVIAGDSDKGGGAGGAGGAVVLLLEGAVTDGESRAPACAKAIADWESGMSVAVAVVFTAEYIPPPRDRCLSASARQPHREASAVDVMLLIAVTKTSSVRQPSCRGVKNKNR